MKPSLKVYLSWLPRHLYSYTPLPPLDFLLIDEMIYYLINCSSRYISSRDLQNKICFSISASSETLTNATS
jgi:hypothetical protein